MRKGAVQEIQKLKGYIKELFAAEKHVCCLGTYKGIVLPTNVPSFRANVRLAQTLNTDELLQKCQDDAYVPQNLNKIPAADNQTDGLATA